MPNQLHNSRNRYNDCTSSSLTTTVSLINNSNFMLLMIFIHIIIHSCMCVCVYVYVEWSLHSITFHWTHGFFIFLCKTYCGSIHFKHRCCQQVLTRLAVHIAIRNSKWNNISYCSLGRVNLTLVSKYGLEFFILNT